MARKEKLITSEEDAFEIIELAINDVELLTRAFQLVEALCDEEEGREKPKQILMN